MRSDRVEENERAEWMADLRNCVSAFITLVTQQRNEPALTWVLQKAVYGLVAIDIPAETILRRLLTMPPGDGEEVPHRSTPQQNA